MSSYDYEDEMDEMDEIEATMYDEDEEQQVVAAEQPKPCCAGKAAGGAAKHDSTSAPNASNSPGIGGLLAVAGGLVVAVGVGIFLRLRKKKKPAKRVSSKSASRASPRKVKKTAARSAKASAESKPSPAKKAAGLPALSKPKKAVSQSSTAAAVRDAKPASAAPPAALRDSPAAASAATRKAVAAPPTAAQKAVPKPTPSASSPVPTEKMSKPAPAHAAPLQKEVAAPLPQQRQATPSEAPVEKPNSAHAPARSPAVGAPSADVLAAANSAVAQARSSSAAEKPEAAAEPVRSAEPVAEPVASAEQAGPQATEPAAPAAVNMPASTSWAAEDTPVASPMASSVKSVDDELKEKLHEKVEHAKLNYNAPEFVPTSKPAAAAKPSPLSEQPSDAPQAAQAAEEAEAQPEAEEEEEQEDDGQIDGEDGQIEDVTDVALAERQTDAAEGSSKKDEGPPECAEDDTEEYEQPELDLAGKDIDNDQPPTDDETAADENLVKVAKSLQNGKYSQEEMVRRGIEDLQKDVEFCATHMCRPSKYAEHASTAADFFFQVSAFKEAEAMLAGAIQAAHIAGNHNLEATLVNNMGTVLRKQKKFKKALSLHRKEMDAVVERHGLESEYIILARHNLVEVLEILRQDDEARAVLESQVQLYKARVEELKQENAAGVEIPSAAGSDSGTPKQDPLTTALHSYARCELDMARFLHREEKTDAAIASARSAFAHATEAHGENSHATAVHLSFLAQLLKVKAERTKDKQAMKEAKELVSRLVVLVESHDPTSRNLPQLYRSVADLCMELGDVEEAFKYGQKIVHISALVCQGNQYHPQLQPIWQYIEEMHSKGGDAAGAEVARKAGLKCKSTAMKSRDASHKAKKQGNSRRGRR